MRFNLISCAVAAPLLLVLTAGFAHGNTISLFSGETLDFILTAVQTSPPGGTTTLDGSFTIGSLIPTTTDWNVTAFDFTGSGCAIGVTSCASLVWTLSGLEFDGSNDTAFGGAFTPYTGHAGDSKKLTLTFLDGNSSTNPNTDLDLTLESQKPPDFSNDKSGTFGYALVPEPSYGLLVASVLGLAAVWRTRSSRQKSAR